MTQAPGQFSPDGQWRWDGQRWLPANGSGAPGSSPPKRSRTPWIVGGAAVVVLALVAVLVIVFSASGDSDPDSDDSASSKPSASKSTEPDQPEVTPVRCTETTAATCFPNLSISRDLLPAVQSQGFSCEDDGKYAKRCTKRTGDSDSTILDVTFKSHTQETDKLTELSVTGSTASRGGDSTDRSTTADQRTVDALAIGLKLVFPTAQRTQQDIENWARQTMGSCPRALGTSQKIGGFDVRCTNSTPPVVVGGPQGPVTTWAGIVTVATPGLIPPPGPS